MSRTITSFGRTLVSAIRSEGPLAGPSVVKRGISSIGAEPIKGELWFCVCGLCLLFALLFAG